MSHCEFCGREAGAVNEVVATSTSFTRSSWVNCPSCLLYNAAVAAQKQAAQEIVLARHPGANCWWLNDHGIFCYVDGVCKQVGTPEEAAPFAALTGVARRVEKFWEPEPA